MSTSALQIHRLHLDAQLGDKSPITEEGIYDPTGDNVTIYGVLEDHTYAGIKDSGNVTQRLDGIRFVISNPIAFDLYTDKQIYFPYRDKTYTIEKQETDLQGVQVLWVY